MTRERPFPQSLFSAGREMERAVMTIRFMAIKTPSVCAIDKAVPSKVAGKRNKLYAFILMSNMLAQRKRFNFSRQTSKDALIPRVDTQAFSTSFFSSSPSIPPPQRSGDKCPIKQRRKRGEKEKGGVEEKT